MAAVIILILFGVCLIGLNYRAIKVEKNSFTNALNNSSENMEGYRVELNNLRKDFSESILELQLQIENLNKKSEDKYQDEISYELYDKIAKNYKDASNHKDEVVMDKEIIEDEVRYEEKVEKSDAEVSNNKTVKVKEIKELFDKGLGVDEISEKTGINKGEVLLIKELYIR